MRSFETFIETLSISRLNIHTIVIIALLIILILLLTQIMYREMNILIIA